MLGILLSLFLVHLVIEQILKQKLRVSHSIELIWG